MPKQNRPPSAGFNIPDNNPTTTTNVVVVQAAVQVPVVLPKNEMQMTCPSCQQHIKTKVYYKATSKTHCWACVLCFILCPLFWLPYCMKSCRQANHTCRKCGVFIGSSIV